MNELRIELPESIPTEETRLELAMALYANGRLTQGEAARTTGLSGQPMMPAHLSLNLRQSDIYS